jgi:acetyltransferase-like isoleucine patch superfamily enzyme
VVSRSIPDNTVAAGNPIRFICSTETYRQKMLKQNAGTKNLASAEKKQRVLGLSEDKFVLRKTLQVE